MSKKRFHKLILHFILTLAAIVVLLIAIAFFVAWIAWRSGAPVPSEREDIMWRRELIKNKLYSAALISLGALSIPIEYDATAFIFTLIMGLPLFFAKENWIM